MRDIVAQLPSTPNSPYLQRRTLDQINLIAVHWVGSGNPRPNGNYDALARITGIAHYHMQKDWSSNGSGVFGFSLMYHRVITGDGTIYLTVPLEWITWNAYSPSNEHDLAILIDCGIGQGGNRQQPTAAQLASLKWYLDQLTQHTPQIRVGKGNVYGHRELPNNNTECPGTLLPYVQSYRNSGGW
jgi:N-acetyl-anhydromuramyl-L-alanine amidase AmpD